MHLKSLPSKRSFGLLLTLCLCTAALGAEARQERPKTMVGWVEKVYIEAIDTRFSAKLDTGARTSSIGADIIDVVEYPEESDKEKKADRKKNKHRPKGKIIFMIEDEDGDKKTLERDIVRWVRIKKKGDKGFIRRPVVHMRFCIAGTVIDDEVNLAVRDRFIYPVLIGRNMLEKGRLVVDVSRKETSPAHCPQANEQ